MAAPARTVARAAAGALAVGQHGVRFPVGDADLTWREILSESRTALGVRGPIVTIPRLLVESALASATSETPTERRNAMAELFALHRLLAAVSNNVNQMARATNATGEVQAEMSATLDAVRRTAVRIDDAIDGLSLP